MVLIVVVSSGCIVATADETTTKADNQISQNNEQTIVEASLELEQQRQELEANLEKNRQKLSQYQESSEATEDYIDLLDEEIGLINQELELLNKEVLVANRKVDKLGGEVAELKEKLDAVQKKYDEAVALNKKLNEDYETTYAAYCLRLRAMYISGANSVIVALLTSKDIGQFLDRYEMIKAITKSDSQLLKEVQGQIEQINKTKALIKTELDELSTDKQELDEKQNELESEKNKVESKQNEIATKKVSLSEKRAKSDSLLAELNKKTQMYSEFKYEDEQMLQQVDQEIDDLINGLKEPSEVTTANSSNVQKNDKNDDSDESALYYHSNAVYNMTYPAPGHYNVSCGYGTYSNGKAHPAIDFPYPVGSKVVAAQKGIVITVKRLNYSYGYYVMVYHGTDSKGRKVVTLYAHNSSILVSVGQTVKKGQQIAKGGSTGNSTGPHCHFEIRAGSEKLNPTTYLSKS